MFREITIEVSKSVSYYTELPNKSDGITIGLRIVTVIMLKNLFIIILINYKSLFQEKNSLQLNHFQFSKMNYYQIQQFVYKNFVLENVFLMVSAIKKFIFENQKL